MISLPEQRQHGPRVTVAVDDDETSLDQVVTAAREADRRGVALELVIAPATGNSAMTGSQRAKLCQRMDQAVGLARSVAPGLEVQLPYANLFAPAE